MYEGLIWLAYESVHVQVGLKASVPWLDSECVCVGVCVYASVSASVRETVRAKS